MTQKKQTYWWAIAGTTLVVAMGVALAFYVHSNTTQIRQALAEEVLQQQHDVAMLIQEYSGVMLALEREQLNTQGGNREGNNGESDNGDSLQNALATARRQLLLMRSNYSFERLDGAAKAHAFAKPVLEDVEQWLNSGLPGYQPERKVVLSMASKRLGDRYNRLREIALETEEVASSLITTQTGFLDRFRVSLIILLAGYALVALCIFALLLRQRNLQERMAKDHEHYAQRFRDFAAVGADWFWETDSQLNMINDSHATAFDAPRPVNARKTFQQRAFSRIPEKSRVPSSQVQTGATRTNRIKTVRLPLEEMQQQKSFQGIESSWTTPDGKAQIISINAKPLFDDDGSFLGYRGIGRDITQRKRIESELHEANLKLIAAETSGRQQAEQALSHSEIFLRTTLDALPSRIAILDQQSSIIAANSAWKALLNEYTREIDNGGIGLHYLQAYDARPSTEKEGILACESAIERVLQGEQKDLRSEFTCTVQDMQHWIVISVSTFESNNTTYAILIHEDVTEWRQLEHRDRRLRTELAHAGRLATAGEMASGLAHELNQPLTAISHNCDALMMGISGLTASANDANRSEAELTETARDIYEQTQRAGGIIRSMRQLVRKDTTTSKSVDLNNLVRETVRLTHPEAHERNITVTLDLANDLPRVMLDPIQIQQVLVNLERNAVEAIANSNPKIRELVISTTLLSASSPHNDMRGLSQQQLIQHDTIIQSSAAPTPTMEPPTICVSVMDTGSGLAPEIRDELFTAFRTTKENGMGLGLSISRSIVEAHGGRLWVNAENTGPTQFNFTIPLERSQRERS